ncbi:hypothetical protein BASA84_000445 [Batrachochytrium salamandrivorans]|nr:hypothetical protein BASA84_000445 [Batrachochytrium salamandrivorans]
MSNWFASLASGEGVAALSNLVQQAVSTVESGIDKVLDIQPDENSAQSLAKLSEFGFKGSNYDKNPKPASPITTDSWNAAEDPPASKQTNTHMFDQQKQPSKSTETIPKRQDDFFMDIFGGIVSSSSSALTPTAQIDKTPSLSTSAKIDTQSNTKPTLKTPLVSSNLESFKNPFPSTRRLQKRVSLTSDVPKPIDQFNPDASTEVIPAADLESNDKTVDVPLINGSDGLFNKTTSQLISPTDLENLRTNSNSDSVISKAASVDESPVMEQSVSLDSKTVIHAVDDIDDKIFETSIVETPDNIDRKPHKELIGLVESTATGQLVDQAKDLEALEKKHIEPSHMDYVKPASIPVEHTDKDHAYDQILKVNLQLDAETTKRDSFGVESETHTATDSSADVMHSSIQMIDSDGIVVADKLPTPITEPVETISLAHVAKSESRSITTEVLSDQGSDDGKSLQSYTQNVDSGVISESIVDHMKEDINQSRLSTTNQVLMDQLDHSDLPCIPEPLAIPSLSPLAVNKIHAEMNARIIELQTELDDAKRSALHESTALQSVVDALRERTSTLESQILTLQNERDLGLGSHIKNSSSDDRLNGITRALRDKEESVKGLLAEGEILSKEILKANTTIKRLRTVETDLGKEIKETQKRLDVCIAELKQVKDNLSKVTDSEKKLSAKVRELESRNDQQLKQKLQLEKEVVSTREKCTEIQDLFEASVKELNDLRNQEHDIKIAAKTEVLETEMRENTQLREQLDTLRKEAGEIEEALHKDVYDLRTDLAKAQDAFGWKEDNYQREIDALNQRLQSTEARCEDLTATMQDSTEPLLHQIHSLQSQYNQGLSKWEHVERSYMQRLQDAETQRSEAVDREGTLKRRTLELTTYVTSLDSQYLEGRQENSRLVADLEAEREKSARLSLEITKMQEKSDMMSSQLEASLENARRDYEDQLEARLSDETKKWENRLQVEQQRLQKYQQPQYERGYSVSSDSRPRISSVLQTDSGDIASSPENASSPVTPFQPGASGVVIIERLQTTIKQNESQVASLKLQLRMATQMHNEMSNELVRITAEGEDLKAKADLAQTTELQLAETNKRYNTMLEILGEKTERVEELEEDISDMRLAFKAQVEDLVRQLGGRTKMK